MLRQNHFLDSQLEMLEKNTCQSHQGFLKNITHVLTVTMQDLHLSLLMQYTEMGFAQKIHSQYSLLRFDNFLLAPLIQSFPFQPHTLVLQTILKVTEKALLQSFCCYRIHNVSFCSTCKAKGESPLTLRISVSLAPAVFLNNQLHVLLLSHSAPSQNTSNNFKQQPPIILDNSS